MYEPRSVPPYPRGAATLKYERLKSHSLIESLLKLFMQKPDQTRFSFDQVQRLLRSRQEEFRGTQLIPLSHIVGSVGRYRDFDRAFLPLEGANQERWTGLDVALNELRNVPPIEVYQIGDVYFVRDGNHRVSVAKANGLTHKRSEADLYLWVSYHRERLHARFGVTFPDTVVANHLVEEFSERPLARLSKTVVRAMNAAVRAARSTPEPPNFDATGAGAPNLVSGEI
jgi:hypothetical protein